LNQFVSKVEVCPAYTDASAYTTTLLADGDWSNCAHLSIRRVLSISKSAILMSTIFSVKHLIPQKLLNLVAP